MRWPITCCFFTGLSGGSDALSFASSGSLFDQETLNDPSAADYVPDNARIARPMNVVNTLNAGPGSSQSCEVKNPRAVVWRSKHASEE
jgi:hypothetical protein